MAKVEMNMDKHELRFTRFDDADPYPDVACDDKLQGIRYLLTDIDDLSSTQMVCSGLLNGQNSGEWYELQFNSSIIDFDGKSTVRIMAYYSPSPICLMQIDDVEPLLLSWEKWAAGEFRIRKSRIYSIAKEKIRFRPRSDWP